MGDTRINALYLISFYASITSNNKLGRASTNNAVARYKLACLLLAEIWRSVPVILPLVSETKMVPGVVFVSRIN